MNKLQTWSVCLTFFIMGAAVCGLSEPYFKEAPESTTERVIIKDDDALDSAIIRTINARLASLESSALDHAALATRVNNLDVWADKTTDVLNSNMRVYSNRDKRIYETIRVNDGIIGRQADKAKEIAEKALAKAEKIEFDLLPWESVPQKTSEPDSSPEKDDERTEN
jgi:hypothetical protein